MASNFAIDSGFLDDRYPGRGISGRYDTRAQFLELEVTTEPTIEPVSLDDIKNEIRVRHSEDDIMLDGYIKQAVADVENFTGRAVANQTIEAYWKRVYTHVWLPRPKHISITSVTEITDDGTETTLTTDDYDLLGNNEYLIQFDNVIDNQLKVVFEAGYGTTENALPRWAKSAVAWQTKLYYQKEPDLAINAASGLAVPAYIAAKDHVYIKPS